jgi:hypothetical protein
MDVSISSSFLSYVSEMIRYFSTIMLDFTENNNCVLIDEFFFIRLAKEILSYRIALRDSAAYNALLFGYEGWRYLIHYKHLICYHIILIN